ncbi:MAG TPA: FmdB family transcriptional regulator [Candidatus Didemnitutus sp.]|nr:FmdB family transcriptional regulator [Candidatus Didemnitutus sp.]
MPIYEYYSPDTNRIYSFYAKTLAQGKLVPRCPDNPKARMVKLVSSFAVGGQAQEETSAPTDAPGDDPRLEAAAEAMEKEFSHVDENDPKAMARMMRRMAQITGEKLDGPMEEAVRKLEEGADPDSLESEMGEAFGDDSSGPGMASDAGLAETKSRRRKFRSAPVRDPKLYDYD